MMTTKLRAARGAPAFAVTRTSGAGAHEVGAHGSVGGADAGGAVGTRAHVGAGATGGGGAANSRGAAALVVEAEAVGAADTVTGSGAPQ
jgi:hypothetical protein